MAYPTEKLLTATECDQAIDMANVRIEAINYEQTLHGHALTGKERTTNSDTASLASVKAEITGVEAGIAVLSEGEEKRKQVSRLRKLNDRKDNLEERLLNGGNVSLLDSSLDATLLASQLTEINGYIAAINARKGTL